MIRTSETLDYSSTRPRTDRRARPAAPLERQPDEAEFPWPMSASRLHKLSMCVMSRSRHPCGPASSRRRSAGTHGIDAKMDYSLSRQPLVAATLTLGCRSNRRPSGRSAHDVPCTRARCPVWEWPRLIFESRIEIRRGDLGLSGAIGADQANSFHVAVFSGVLIRSALHSFRSDGARRCACRHGPAWR